MIGVDESLLRRTPGKVIGMMRQELVERICGGDQQRQRRRITAPGPACLLGEAGNGTRIADEQRRAQPADVYSKFEGVCGNNGLDGPIAQAFFNLTALGREITAAVTAYARGDIR